MKAEITAATVTSTVTETYKASAPSGDASKPETRPIHHSSATSTAAASRPAHLATHDGPLPLRILAVDDNESIHHDYKKILASDTDRSNFDELEASIFGNSSNAPAALNFELDSAFQGQEALEMVRRALATGRPYAMAFVDIRMPPGWDGIETVEQIWKVDPDLQVVICTAYSDYSWNEMMAKLGRTDRFVILKKPFDIIEIKQLAYALTEKWQLNRRVKMQVDTLEGEVAMRTSELARSVSLLNATLESTPDGIIALNTEGQISNLNGKFLNIWDIARPMAESHDVDALIGFMAKQVAEPANFPETAKAFYLRVEKLDFEVLRLNDGRMIERYSQPQYIGSEIIGRVCCFRDVTKREQLEDQLRQAQKMESVGRLAGGIAHDFNNILTIIQGHAGLSLTSANDPTLAESLQQIYEASDRAAKLTKQLLTFSRKQLMRRVQLDLGYVVRNVGKMLHRVVREDISFRFNCPDSPMLVNADAGMMEQILMNLTINSRDAMPKGGTINIEVSVENMTNVPGTSNSEIAPGHYVCLRFSDTGCGISPEHLRHVFEPFFTTKDVGKGTGLGLATVYGIVKQHKGWVTVESTVGKGTTFSIFLPQVSPSEETASTPPPTPVQTMGHETILLVEDEAQLRQLLAKVLQQSGYKVVTATNAVEAEAIWREQAQSIDLLLTDIIMPEGVTGCDLAIRLKAQRPQLKVIFTSGYSRNLIASEIALQEGVNYLPKPYHPGKVVQMVRSCLDRPASF